MARRTLSLAKVFESLVSFCGNLRRGRLLDAQQGIESIRRLHWREFEQLVSEAFRREGYSVRETQRGADGGVDIWLRRDGRTVAVQCKHWKSFRVGVPVVRELLGVIHHDASKADEGIIVCTGYYTEEAIVFARGAPIRLIDGRTLWRMVAAVQAHRERKAAEHEGNRVLGWLRRVRAHRIIQAAEGAASLERTCRRCGHGMVLRTARKGKHKGREFFGCTRFPKCHYTEQL